MRRGNEGTIKVEIGLYGEEGDRPMECGLATRERNMNVQLLTTKVDLISEA